MPSIPEWHVWTDFCTTRCAALAVMRLMAYNRSKQLFIIQMRLAIILTGAIVYAKGGRLLLHAMHRLGSCLRAGLQAYFASHAYSNAEGDDLRRALESLPGAMLLHL